MSSASVVCNRMPWRSVLQTLMAAGFLNRGASGLLVSRTFPEPLGWARVVSIKPEIQKYRTAAESAERARDPWGTKRRR